MRSLYAFTFISVVAAAVPAAGQTRITQSGPVPHQAAAAVFPERVGEFRRTGVVQYDAKGEDMSAGYNLVTPEGRLTVTVYIYPPRETAPDAERAAACRREFDSNLREISSAPAYKDLRREPTAPLPASTGVSPDLSHGANFRLRATFDKPDQDLQSTYRLHCYVGGRWLVKYRATSPYGYPAEQALEQFIRTGPWPGRGSPGNTVARPRTESAG
jgi:hypothetical protein